MWCVRFSVPSFPRDLISVCNVSSYEISIPRAHGVCIDSGFRFSEMGLSWVATVVLRSLSWGRVGCLGCFVDSRLQICNSPNRWVRVSWFSMSWSILRMGRGERTRVFVM